MRQAANEQTVPSPVSSGEAKRFHLEGAAVPHARINKVASDAADVLRACLRSGMSVAAGGFGLCGIPEHCIDAIVALGVRDLTVVSNNCGVDGFGLGKLLEARQIKRILASYVGENKEFARQFLAKEVEVELVPQGSLAERLRAGGAGIPAFYTPAGVGSPLEEGKETRVFNGKRYVLEHGIRTDVAIVKAWKGDAQGNLVYRMTARNFNPLCAAAGAVTIAEVEELVPVGALDPDAVHTPGIFVQHIVQGAHEKRIERRTLRNG